MADQEDAEKLMQQLVEMNKPPMCTVVDGVYVYRGSTESSRSFSDAMTRNFSYTVNQPQTPQFNGYIVLNARAIALDAPDKLVKRAIKLPFVPMVGMALKITDEWAIDSGVGDGSLVKQYCSFVLRVTEMLWDEQQEQFQVRCEKIDGQGYERLADAVYWGNYKW